MESACRICGHLRDNKVHLVREMGFGTRDAFQYVECGSCGCLQIDAVPADVAKYYPPNYYSFQEHGLVKTWLRRQWSRYSFEGTGIIGKALAGFFVPNHAMEAVRRCATPKQARILDVGCGSGRLLLDLAYLGFKNLEGADPFIDRDISYPNGVRVFKRTLAEMPPGYDMVMLNHSFEHMDRPADVMRDLYMLVKPGGSLIIRIPIVSSFAWRTYGVNWINLDAPRHFYLHSFKSMDLLTQSVGFLTGGVIHEGNDEQFWGSEQYARDIPYNDPRSFGSSLFNRLRGWRTIREWKRRAAELNRLEEADLVCFQLIRPA